MQSSLAQKKAKKTGTTNCTVSSLRCVSAAEHHTAEQYCKTHRTKHRRNLSWKKQSIMEEAIKHGRSNQSWKKQSIMEQATNRGILARISSRYKVSEKPLWKPSECESQKSSNITPNISNCFSTVPPIVNLDDWRYIMRDQWPHRQDGSLV